MSSCRAIVFGGVGLLIGHCTSPHASADRDGMALPPGIKVAFEGLGWGLHINDSVGAWSDNAPAPPTPRKKFSAR